MGKNIINEIIKEGKNKKGSKVCLTKTIEDVFFISVEGEITANTTDKWEAYYVFDLTIKGHKHYKNFGGSYNE